MCLDSIYFYCIWKKKKKEVCHMSMQRMLMDCTYPILEESKVNGA